MFYFLVHLKSLIIIMSGFKVKEFKVNVYMEGMYQSTYIPYEIKNLT